MSGNLTAIWKKLWCIGNVWESPIA